MYGASAYGGSEYGGLLELGFHSPASASDQVAVSEFVNLELVSPSILQRIGIPEFINMSTAAML